MARRARQDTDSNSGPVSEVGEGGEERGMDEGNRSTTESASESGNTSGGASETARDPNEAIGEPQPKTRKPRSDAGKPRGPRASAGTGAKASMGVNELATQIQGLHTMLAIVSGSQVWILQPNEAQAMAQALCDVESAYGIRLFKGKTASLIKLVATAGFIYLPRMIIFRQQTNAQRAAQDQQPQASTTEDFVRQPSGQFDFSAVQMQEAA